jgi:ribosome maturation factor RimP
MISKEKVRKLVEERIEGTDIFIVDIDISSGNKISITIDADSGVNITKCMSVSRNVEHNLDRDEEDFSLEVTSFGLSSPLVLPRQYKKYMGKMIEVTTLEMKKFKGKLLDFNENELSLELDLTKKQKKSGTEANIIISFKDIKETKAVISFKK